MPDTPGDFDYEAALAACAAGDRQAMQRLYEQEGARLLGVALRIVGACASTATALHGEGEHRAALLMVGPTRACWHIVRGLAQQHLKCVRVAPV